MAADSLPGDLRNDFTGLTGEIQALPRIGPDCLATSGLFTRVRDKQTRRRQVQTNRRTVDNSEPVSQCPTALITRGA